MSELVPLHLHSLGGTDFRYRLAVVRDRAGIAHGPTGALRMMGTEIVPEGSFIGPDPMLDPERYAELVAYRQTLVQRREARRVHQEQESVGILVQGLVVSVGAEVE